MLGDKQLRIGIVIPQLPSLRCEGIELAVDNLARGLHERGHEVVQFTVEDPMSEQRRSGGFKLAEPYRIGSVARGLYDAAAIEGGELGDCDVIHDHTLASLFLRNLNHRVPIVATNHGQFNDELISLHRCAGIAIPMIAVSHDQADRAPKSIGISTVIHQGVDPDQHRLDPTGGDYIAVLAGRDHNTEIDFACDVAKRSGLPLKVASITRDREAQARFHTMLEPRLGAGLEYLGHVGQRDKLDLVAGAKALLNPVRWPEPFGLSMVEAMACGTPVVATSSGAASEIVVHGTTGFVVDGFDGFVEALGRVESLDRRRCRQHVEANFHYRRTAYDHESLFLDSISSPGWKGDPDVVQLKVAVDQIRHPTRPRYWHRSSPG